MTPPTPKAEVEKPGTPPEVVAPPAFDAEKAVADLTAKVEGLEAGIAAALEAEVAKYLGEGSPLAATVDEAIKRIDEAVQAKTAELGEDASTELQKAIKWAHARIGALHNGVQRAIGVEIPLPQSPSHEVTGDVTVTGTETADRLG